MVQRRGHASEQEELRWAVQHGPVVQPQSSFAKLWAAVVDDIPVEQPAESSRELDEASLLVHNVASAVDDKPEALRVS